MIPVWQAYSYLLVGSGPWDETHRSSVACTPSTGGSEPRERCSALCVHVLERLDSIVWRVCKILLSMKLNDFRSIITSICLSNCSYPVTTSVTTSAMSRCGAACKVSIDSKTVCTAASSVFNASLGSPSGLDATANLLRTNPGS